MDDKRALAMQQMLAEELRRPSVSVRPQLEMDDNFAIMGGDVRADIPLGKNTTLGVMGGGAAGRGYGRAKGAKMPFNPRFGIDLRHEF